MIKVSIVCWRVAWGFPNTIALGRKLPTVHDKPGIWQLPPGEIAHIYTRLGQNGRLPFTTPPPKLVGGGIDQSCLISCILCATQLLPHSLEFVNETRCRRLFVDWLIRTIKN
jgi:hypothetical protein